MVRGSRGSCWDPSHISSSPGSGLCWRSDRGHVLLLLCASVSPTENGDWETLALWGCVGFLSLPNMRSVILILGTRPVGEGVSRLSSPLQSRLGVTSPLGQHGQPSGGRVDQGPGQGVSVPLHPHHPLPPPALGPTRPWFPLEGHPELCPFCRWDKKDLRGDRNRSKSEAHPSPVPSGSCPGQAPPPVAGHQAHVLQGPCSSWGLPGPG